MESLGQLLLDNGGEVVQRWYDRWQKEGPLRPDMTEAALKNSLPVQVRAIAEALCEPPDRRESPRALWTHAERLNPEQRLHDDVPIEETVREYGFVMDEIRLWLQAKNLTVARDDLAYLSVALFELAAESARRYAKRQEDIATHQRSRYVAGIAHQMRTPISVLKVQMHQIEKWLDPKDPRRERLNRTLGRFQRLVNGLLRVERFTAHEQPVHPIELSPAQVLDEIIGDYQVDASAKGLHIEVRADRAVRMTADPDLLVDALGNLVQNAIKYTAKGFVRAVMEEDADDLMFRIEDSGPGISAQRLKKLTREIQRGEQGGVGLGLTIARHAVESMGGAIEIISRPGRGSTFVLRIPRVVQARS